MNDGFRPEIFFFNKPMNDGFNGFPERFHQWMKGNISTSSIGHLCFFARNKGAFLEMVPIQL